jgi:hypothetical protein
MWRGLHTTIPNKGVLWRAACKMSTVKFELDRRGSIRGAYCGWDGLVGVRVVSRGCDAFCGQKTVGHE